ncbi:MAG: family 1 encapsulin nanocompartment shell protein, partial [Myxococcota bacterium]
AEDSALFDGNTDADIPGILSEAAHDAVTLPANAAHIPDAVSEALEKLRRAGVSGPYGLALGPESHAALDRTAPEGYPVLRHVERLIDGAVVWAPSLHGGVVMSLRGGDFKLVCGRDAAIGYLSHDEKRVRLYLEESFSAEVNAPEAAVPLAPPETRRKS